MTAFALCTISYRSGEENAFDFNMCDNLRKGHCFRDYICQDSIEKNADYLKLSEKFARVLYLKDYTSYIKYSMVAELMDLNRNMMLSIDIIPIPNDEAVREVENRLSIQSKQTARSTGKATVKTANATVKTTDKAIKATERTSKVTVKAAIAAYKAAVAVGKAIASAVKAIIAAVKELVAAIAAGGWVAVVVIVVIFLIGNISGEPY